jgi:hypothetical protein
MNALQLIVASLGTLSLIGQIYLYLAFSKPGIPFGAGEWLLWGLTMTTVVGCVVVSAYKMLSIT